MRMRVLVALVVGLAVSASAEATWPRTGGWGGGYYGGTPMYTVPATPTYYSGTVVGGPMFVADMNATTTVVERTGPFGLFRRRVVMVTPTPVMPPTVTATTTTTPPAIVPATATTTPPTTTVMPAAPTAGVVTSGYVVPPAGTVTVLPAQYSWRPFFRNRMMYSTSPMVMSNGTTYYTTPGSVTTATYVVPETATPTYYYPTYGTGRYFGFSGFGFRWR